MMVKQAGGDGGEGRLSFLKEKSFSDHWLGSN